MRTTVHESSFVDDGAHVGDGSRIWHFSHVCSGAHIGKNVSVGQNVFIASGDVIGNNCKIQNNVSIYDGVRIDDDVFCGPSVVFTNVLNPRASVSRKNEFKATNIKRGATIGANATIVCGVTIDVGTFIGAGAVVTTSTDKYGLYLGVPAKRVGWMSANGDRMHFSKDNNFEYRCPISDLVYYLVDDQVDLKSPIDE